MRGQPRRNAVPPRRLEYRPGRYDRAPAEAAADAHLLFDRDGFREIARLVDVAALLQRNMVSEQLKRDIEQQRIEFGRGRWHLESRIDRDRKAAGVRDGNDRSMASADFLDGRQILWK